MFVSTAATDYPSLYDGWMYPQNSLIKKIFDHQIHKLKESGIVDKFVDRREFEDEPDELLAVNFQFVLILFVILSLGVVLSIIIFIFERFSSLDPIRNVSQWP